MKQVPLRSQGRLLCARFRRALFQRCSHKVKGAFAMVSLLALVLGTSLYVMAGTKVTEEYNMKAAFLYQFLAFAEWPKEAFANNEDTITIGILGEDPFGDMFKSVEGELVDGRRLVIKRFEESPSAETLQACQVLFISSSLAEKAGVVLEAVNDHPVLTVSEVKGFAELGGIVNFVMKKDQLRFEINKGAAERVGIKFPSKLLRVAERIVGTKSAD